MPMRPIAALSILLAACATTDSLQPIPPEWTAVPRTGRIRSLTLDAEGNVGTLPDWKAGLTAPIRVKNNRLYNGDKALTDAFEAIDSFDFSEPRGEVVFSAKREGGFDIGLVSSDGSPINWLPPDPSDECAVQWAPRGNKVSYVVRASGGDVVRSFHVPSSVHLNVPFPLGTVHALAWDPLAERFAVAWSSPEASDTVEVMRYGGEERKVVLPSKDRIDVEIEPLGRGSLLLRRRDVAYGERLPLVVWIVDDLGWSDARAALLRSARVACIVTTRPPDEALWKAAAERAWIDTGRAYVVGGTSAAPSPGPAVRITADGTVPEGQYRVSGRVVAVAPAVVQSFAAGFVPAHLRASAPPE